MTAASRFPFEERGKRRKEDQALFPLFLSLSFFRKRRRAPVIPSERPQGASEGPAFLEDATASHGRRERVERLGGVRYSVTAATTRTPARRAISIACSILPKTSPLSALR